MDNLISLPCSRHST